jgi:hypothetical protein
MRFSTCGVSSISQPHQSGQVTPTTVPWRGVVSQLLGEAASSSLKAVAGLDPSGWELVVAAERPRACAVSVSDSPAGPSPLSRFPRVVNEGLPVDEPARDARR